MAEYYLISQLPSLDGIGDGTPMPIDEERFSELCGRFLGKGAQSEIEKLTLMPPKTPEKSSSALLEEWYKGERELRLALAKVRAEKMQKSFDLQDNPLPAELIKVADDAVNAKNPLEAEELLFNHRINFLESLRPMDNFSKDFVFYYGLKLKLIMRKRQFDTKPGQDAYRNIYDSIINGEKLEEIK